MQATAATREVERTDAKGITWVYSQTYLPYRMPLDLYGWFTTAMLCKCHGEYADFHYGKTAKVPA
jgi:hypothetical protein